MAVCKKRLSCLFVPALLVGFIGCGYTQQHQRFQTAFLPSSPQVASLSGATAPEPPPVVANPYLNEAPKFLLENPHFPPRPTHSDALIEEAEQRFQKGRSFYQAKDPELARKEFDAAIDLMLEASKDPSDPPAYEAKLEHMVDTIHRYDLAGLGAGAEEVAELEFQKAPLEDILQMTFPVDPKLKNKVTEQLQATVSQLPLVLNDTVLGYIQYFSGRGRKTMISGLQRAGRFKPLIQRILDEEGVPQELIYLAQAESGFLPRAVSRKAAVGMWQFLKWRGQEYGLKQTGHTDDRLDVEKATRAAARHLRDLYAKFGDWYLAMAAYNCGPGAVERAIERTGHADFWQLRNLRVLPAQTTSYVPIILAMTIMVKNASEYGLDNVRPDEPMSYDSVEITSPTHLALVADLTDAPVSELFALNPALLNGLAPQGYHLRVPKGTAGSLMAALQNIPADRRASWRIHRVESGDTLTMIAKRYRTTSNAIATANRLESDFPVAGDRLVIPASIRTERAGSHFTGRRSRTARGFATVRRSARTRGFAARSHRRGTSLRTGYAHRRIHRTPAVLNRTASVRGRSSLNR